MLNSSWRNRIMIVKHSCSNQTLWLKQPSIPPPAISMLRNRLSQRPKPKRSERGSPTRQTSEALILSVAKLRAELPTLSSTLIRRQYVRQVPVL